MSIFIGTNAGDIIAPGLITPGVLALGPDATPGAGDDIILARGGDDVVAGGLGADTAFLGAGDDVFGWAPADGSDAVFGQAGFDRLDFDGDDSVETFALTAAAGGARLDRTVGAVSMALSSMESIDIFAGGGADVIEIGDLTASSVQEVRVDLAAVADGIAGDGAADLIALSDGDDDSFITLFGGDDKAFVIGLAATIEVEGLEAGDAITINGGRGDDQISISGLDAAIRLTIDGGAGDDLLLGGDGDDTLIGGSGDDFVVGGRGDDTARLGRGDDIFVWDNGDGSDSVDGGRGGDNLAFNGFAAAEVFRLASAAGGRALLTRDVGAIRMDLTSVEGVTIRTDGGADRVEIADLGRTDVREVEIAMGLPGRAGDGAADTVSLIGGKAAEDIVVASGGGSLITVAGLPADVSVFGVEAIDALVVSGGAGDDILTSRDVIAGSVQLTLRGGAGLDFIFGGDSGETIFGGDGDDGLLSGGGDDTVIGGRGDDFARLGAGDDRFGWAPGEGDDVVDGESGTDTLEFLGSNADEVIEIVAEGATALLLRDVADVRMELVDVERIELDVFGGFDAVRVGDLSGTTVTEVVIDLSGQDGAFDFITVQGGAGDDVVTIRADGAAIVVAGLAATVRLIGFDDVFDTLVFSGLGGDDVIDATGLVGINFIALGGEGDDVILGGGGNDALSGDAGDDVILAGAGNDQVFGDVGDDILDGGPGFDALNGGDGADALLNGETVTDAETALLF